MNRTRCNPIWVILLALALLPVQFLLLRPKILSSFIFMKKHYGESSLLVSPQYNDQSLNATNLLPKVNLVTQESIKPFFEGSKIISISPGMDLLENVCLMKAPSRRKTNQLLSFTETAEPLKTSVHNYTRPSWSRWTTITTGRNLSDWHSMTQQYPLIRNETLLTLEIWGNPGHCLNDLVYSIALDANHRQLYETKSGQRPLYPHYLASYFKSLAKGGDDESPNWCYTFLDDTNFLDVHSGPLYHESSILCFERLLVPLLSVHRFPIDWKNPQSKADLFGPSNRIHLTMKQYDQDGPMYPVKALQRLHDNVLRSKRFTAEPWPRENQETDVPTVLLYARQGTKRRVWSNAVEVKEWLERDYHVKVHLVGQEWNSLTPSQQASLYHNYSHIVAVHGAHLANLWYCRKNTRIVEIVCGHADPEPSSLIAYQNESTTTSVIGMASWDGSAVPLDVSDWNMLSLENTACRSFRHNLSM